MTASSSKSLPAIGFLTVLEHRQFGLFGGYLVLNAASRPLEFHCTAPVKPNRAQEILYGPTLLPYLYGEQIGQTLLGKAKTDPLLVCTDVAPALAVRDLVSTPVLLVMPGEDSAEDSTAASDDSTTHRLDAAHASVPAPHTANLISFQWGGQPLAVPAAYEGDRQLATERWQPYADGFDLVEPFCRIREAIEEAQKGI